jgi:exodeoxyribonuclease-5
MMTEEHAEHILAQGIPVVFIGDHGQLPPVQGTPFFKNMDYTLNEICRQKDRELLELLHLIRKNGSVPRVGQGTTYKIVGGEVEDYFSENSLTPNETAVIAYKVSDVRKFNDYFSPNKEPAEGDLIRCYKQYQDRFEGYQRRFRNGFVYEVVKEEPGGTYTLRDVDRGYDLPNVKVNRQLFHCDRIDASIDPDTHEPFDDEVDGMRADFVYSMTGHKSQGSQWPHVIVYASKPGVVGESAWRRWLYTAASRATKYLTIIVPGRGKLQNGV